MFEDALAGVAAARAAGMTVIGVEGTVEAIGTRYTISGLRSLRVMTATSG